MGGREGKRRRGTEETRGEGRGTERREKGRGTERREKG